MIDHRNYDYILEHGYAPKNNIYYNVSSSLEFAGPRGRVRGQYNLSTKGAKPISLLRKPFIIALQKNKILRHLLGDVI